jgi:hypothetical protein
MALGLWDTCILSLLQPLQFSFHESCKRMNISRYYLFHTNPTMANFLIHECQQTRNTFTFMARLKAFVNDCGFGSLLITNR